MKQFFYAFLLVAVIGCSKEKSEPADCKNLKQGLENRDNKLVAAEIDQLAAGTITITAFIDMRVQRENFDRLLERLNSNCKMTAEEVCFNCIDTYPQMSEIRVSFWSGGQRIERIIDVYMMPDSQIRFAAIHE